MKLYETTQAEWNKRPAAIRLKCTLSTIIFGSDFILGFVEASDTDEPPPGRVWLHLNGGFYKKGPEIKLNGGKDGGIQKSEV